MAFVSTFFNIPRQSRHICAHSAPASTGDMLAMEALRIHQLHLRDLLSDSERCKNLQHETENVLVDFSRQLVTETTMNHLHDLANKTCLLPKIQAMCSGALINNTEHRPVLHTALRCPQDDDLGSGGLQVSRAVHDTLQKVYSFARKVRRGEIVGRTGKPLTNVVVVGIGGSFLGPAFVADSIASESAAEHAAKNRTLRFLANVDPVECHRVLNELSPEQTLVVIVSKTFTTAETMRNARIVRSWLRDHLGEDAIAVQSPHLAAVSSNVEEAVKFGVHEDNVFAMWDWVGGRFSTTSAVGVLPLSLQYSPSIVEQFLSGARSMDHHFLTSPIESNIPVLMGLFSVWNSQYLGYPARALLPYSAALAKFADHVQQLAMESNGKRVTRDGSLCAHETGEIDFGQPGTNGQHSFYQLLHQGRTVPADFIGILENQRDFVGDDGLSSHDELMANFFAQPDALALGLTADQLREQRVPEDLIPHKTFPGNRPSTVILLRRLNAYTVGQLLALYEHRTAVQGFLWNVNSFDQFGVELGKTLASAVRGALKGNLPVSQFNTSTASLLSRYMALRK